MAAIVQIPKSTALRFVQQASPQTFDNTLLESENFLNYVRMRDAYKQKFAKTDEIWIQFATDATAITIELFDSEGTLIDDKSADIVTVIASTSFTVYNLRFTISETGTYYVKMQFDTEIFISEPFQIGTFANTILIKYKGSEHDGVIYTDDTYFNLRLEARFAEMQAGSERVTYNSFNQKMVNLKSYPLRSFLFEFGAIPRYILEKLNIALTHETITINGVEYQQADSIEASMLRSDYLVTEMYHGSVVMRQVDYENYETVAEDEPEDTFFIELNTTGDLLLWNETEKIIYKD